MPFFWLLLAASLARDGRQGEAEQVLTDFQARYADFRLSNIERLWPATHPSFLGGRDRIVASVRELGLR